MSDYSTRGTDFSLWVAQILGIHFTGTDEACATPLDVKQEEFTDCGLRNQVNAGVSNPQSVIRIEWFPGEI
jgi:hypothetical protein